MLCFSGPDMGLFLCYIVGRKPVIVINFPKIHNREKIAKNRELQFNNSLKQLMVLASEYTDFKMQEKIWKS